MKIAKEILNQLHTLTPKPVIWSWGAHAYQWVKSNDIEIGENYMEALKFKVKGYKHKGHVLISLAYNDTYTVTIGGVRNGKMSIKKQIKDVYFDELGDTIDELVERQDNYIF